MYYDYDEVKDYGFDEPDVTFLFFTMDEEKVEQRKNRHWFENHEIEEMDYYITYTILVNGKEFITFPKGTSDEAIGAFINAQFEVDEEATKEIRHMNAIHEAEIRFGA